MARPEQCSGCTKPTTIHLSQIINNKIYKLDICEDCPLKKQVLDQGPFSLSEIFKIAMPQSKAGASMVCPECGFTLAEFEKRGRMGCPECYTHFGPSIEPIIEEMHPGTTHAGKCPGLSMKRVDLHREMQRLKQDLQSAVQEEAYEQAAIIRDKIRDLEVRIESLAEEKAESTEEKSGG